VAVRNSIWPMSVSVDGYMEEPNSELDRHLVDSEVHHHMNAWIGDAS
jgi:hypothetical protein